jgi:ribosomal protein S6
MKTDETMLEDADLDMREPRVYEVGYLFIPQIAEEEISGKADVLRKSITDNGGLPISEGQPELIELAYDMRVIMENKWQIFSKAYFGWIKFDVTPEKIADIKEALDGNKELIRYLLVKTVRESIVARPRFSGAPDKEASQEEVDAVAEAPKAPLDEAKIDKQIEDLVVEGEETSEKSE